MADLEQLKAIIAQLSENLKSAADAIDPEGGSGSGSTLADLSERQLEVMSQIREAEKQKIKDKDWINALKREELELELKIAKEVQNPERLQTAREELDALERKIAAQRNLNQSMDDFKKAAKGAFTPISAGFQQITGASAGVTGILKNMGSGFKNAAVSAISMSEKGSSAMGKMSGSKFGPMAIKMAKMVGGIIAQSISGVISVLTDALVAVDEAGVAFARATGSGDRWNSSLGSILDTTYAVGINSKQVAKSFASLIQGFSGFRNVSKAVGEQMGTQVALMEELGVASQTQIQVMDSLNRVMGMSAQDAASYSKDLFDLAEAARMAPQEMFSSFEAALPTLSVYGSKMTGEFQKIVAQSKATGMSVRELLDVVGQFDTFEGAAGAAQSLNAFLGGPYLNTIEMLTATESERVDLLRDSFAQAGTEFKDLDRFAQKGIAKQLGMSVDQARRTFSMSSAEVAKMNEELKKAEEFNTNLEARVKSTMPFMETLKTAFKEIAMALVQTFIPGMDAGGSAMENMQGIMKALHGFVPTIIRSIGSMGAAVMGFVSDLLHTIDYAVLGLIKDESIEKFRQQGRSFQRRMNISAAKYRGGEDIAEGRAMTKMNDFVFTGGSMYPIDSRDQFMGVKPNGHFDKSSKEMSRKMDELTKAINRLAENGGGNTVIEMDGREVGRLVENRIQSNYSYNIPSSGRLR